MSRLLSDASLKSIAEYLNSDVCDGRVFVMCGAGISTSAGIPDFRSPTTGLYANLAKLNLPYPEAVFAIDYFSENPQPFYALARDIAPGRFIPTPTHLFIRLLHQHGKLHTCFTQNIDTLERKAGVPSDKVIEAHGSFASSRCIECKTPYDNEKMAEHIAQARVPRCSEPDCDGLVKPDIVFFGESLPPEFVTAVPALRSAALVIIMGTSLKVQPFAMLPNLVPRTGCPRLLLNLDPAGTIGIRISRLSVRPGQGEADFDSDEEGAADEWEEEDEEEEAWVDDVVHLGHCDTSVRELCDLLGWRDELERAWKEVSGGDSVSARRESERETTATAGDNDVIGQSFGSIELKDGVGSEENAKRPLGTHEGANPAHLQEGEEGSAELKHVNDNSVEETMEKLVLDLEVALNISPNTKPNLEDENLANTQLHSLGKIDPASNGTGDPDA